MTELTKLRGFRLEKELEDYLEDHLSLIVQDLLIIGRQVKVGGGLIDLLAIDSAGVIHIVELKLNEASPSVIAQVLGYRRSIKRMNRDELIQIVADGDLEIDLPVAFQQRFGRPLPETLNDLPALMIIAASIHPRAADSVLELLDEGWTIRTFRYSVHSAGVRLIPCCRTDKEVKEGNHATTSPSAPPDRMNAIPERLPSCRVPIDEHVRLFWQTHVQDFAPFVTFSFIYERYRDWFHAQAVEGVQLRQSGLFARQLSAITGESGEWTRVYVAHRSDMAAYNTFMVPPGASEYRASGHTVAAYKLNPVDPVSSSRRN
ncbi:endonuclease NucS domain-containing protein [Arthrobacter sp. zg-Y1171]|uniref:endonuclease NucS domain-containing protein n=1 Tax=Arthrobacter sp. zg-Y1171 TaxID=2964610 RepID=UPI00210835D6|nr:endonuclease NucS domain-containing protein [Arthrobacter sp. zg-Y1171]MCQ1994533.1 endonuclease NucS [Arthrobacter sp. zg-Y1171]UWX81385.1 endonuclease NucS [Arthrobacter sp. zg-Y1171]